MVSSSVIYDISDKKSDYGEMDPFNTPQQGINSEAALAHLRATVFPSYCPWAEISQSNALQHFPKERSWNGWSSLPVLKIPNFPSTSVITFQAGPLFSAPSSLLVLPPH